MKHTDRFSDRVEDYRRHRPSYPVAVLRFLDELGYLFDGATVADIGAGTGIFTRLLLDAGYEVVAVEPNGPMSGALREALGGHERLRIVDAAAEATSLADRSVDLVTAAQALHWFDAEACRAEFHRITRAPHRVAAIWNARDTTSTPFLVDYEALLQEHGIGYTELMKGRGSPEISLVPFFGHSDIRMFEAPNEVQTHDFEGLVGRLLSSSYGPKPGHPSNPVVMKRLRELFDEHQRSGLIEMRYTTRVYCGEVR